MTKRAPVTFSPKAFLAKVGDGRSIGTYSVDQAIFLQGDTADAVFYLQEGKVMAQVVVDAIREPALLLDGRLRVVAANRGYCLAFKAERKNVQGRPVRAISDGRWDTPEVRAMLVRIRARSFSADFHEMEQDVPGAGRRTLILHASGGVDEAQARRLLLLSIEDVSDRRAAERESAGCSSRWRRCCWQISTRSPTACRSSRASSS